MSVVNRLGEPRKSETTDNLIPFPRQKSMDAEQAAGIDAFLKLSPAQAKAFVFRARVAGRSTAEAFNRPLKLASLGAAHTGDSDAERDFLKAASRRGLIIDRLITDGGIHRCDVEGNNGGKVGKGTGAYRLKHYDDGPSAGGFQNWRDGDGWEKWQGDSQREYTAEEKAAYAAKRKAEDAYREARLVKQQAETAKRAKAIVDGCEDVPTAHPYFIKKGIKPPRGVRYSEAPVAISSWRNSAPEVLIVPMRDINGVLWNAAPPAIFYILQQKGSAELANPDFFPTLKMAEVTLTLRGCR
jgi:hypothetical protein